MEVMPRRAPSSAHYQLTPLWERLLRTHRLPKEVDLDEVFEALRRRLKDPEREVRQHALRVLADLIPAISSSLDDRMTSLLDDVLLNLGHPAPAVRKGSLDALKVYLSHSETRENVFKGVCMKCNEINPNGNKQQEDVAAGIIIALPSLFLSSLSFDHDLSNTVSTVIQTLSSKLMHVNFQESAMRSLIKIKEIIGEEDFDRHYDQIKGPHTSENFKTLCKTYSSTFLSDTKKNAFDDFKPLSPQNQEIIKSNLRSPKKVAKNENADSSEHIPNGKIILETELMFDSDTAITMTIMEEDEEASKAVESEDEYSSGGKSVVKILSERDENEYDASRRTPRRVRFGGEVVKMRTPDSDNIVASDPDETKKTEEIREDENPKIKRTKSTSSLIPVPKEPMTSLPKYSKTQPLNPKKNKSKSLNDLSMYCKNHFGSSQDIKSSSEDEQNINKKTKPIVSLTSEEILGLDDSNSGNSSNGSGCSDDKVLEDFSGLSTLDNVILQDLFRMEGQRGAIQALEKLAQRLSDEPEIGARLTGTQAGAAAVRLSTAARRVRGRPSEAATACLRALIRTTNSRALKAALPAFATAIAGAGTRATPLITELARRIPPGDIIEALLNEMNPHWKSCKLVAGALRGVSILVRAAPGASVRVRSAVAVCVSCCTWPRRRVRAAALDALAALASISSPRLVLAEVHRQTEMSRDGDQLYDAVLARLCRPAVSLGSAAGVRGGVRRADVSWINAGRGDISPSSSPRKFTKKSDAWQKPPSAVASLETNSLTRHPMTSSAFRMRHDFNDGTMSKNENGRVVTAPAAGLSLRPLTLPAAAPGVTWTQQIQTWPSQAVWSPNSAKLNSPGSWNNNVGPHVVGYSGAWTNQMPPILKSLSPSHQHSKWSPLKPEGDSNNINEELSVITARLSEGVVINGVSSNNHQNRINMEAKEDIIHRSPSNKSEVNNINKWSAASNHRNQTPVQHELAAPSPSVTVRSSTATISDHQSIHKHADSVSNSSNDVMQAPPNIEDDEDIYEPPANTSRSPSIESRSLKEKRFCDEEDDLPEDENQLMGSEEKFPKFGVLEDIEEVDGETGSRQSLKSRTSIKSFVIPASPKIDTDKNHQPVSAPPIAFMGSSVSTEEDIKSNESDSSYRDSIKSYSSDGHAIFNDEGIMGSKISPSQKVKSTTRASKLSKNKIQPLQNENLDSPGSPFEKPKEALNKSLMQLEHSDWAVIMNGLSTMERLFKHHPVFMEPHLTLSTRAVALQIKNLRSQVARAACKLAGDMFVAQKKYIESDADELALPLLNRTADTNKFLRADANVALDKMCESIGPQKAISILMTRGTAHQNAVVRCTATRLMAGIVKTNGSEKIFSMPKKERDKFLQTAADLLTEGSLETRGYAKQLFKELSQNYLFLRTIREVIPLSKYRSIEKAINQIRIN